jgi:hypothetical protein
MKWYDYVAAVIFADFIIANVALALAGPTLFIQIFGSIGAAFLYDFWVNVYCKFRLNMKMKDGE